MSDKYNDENSIPDLSKAKSLMERLDTVKEYEIVQELVNLLEDKLAIIRLQRSIEEIEDRLYKGKRAMFAAQTLCFDEEQIVLTLEKASRKAKRLLELEKRKENAGNGVSEENLEKLKSMGLLPSECENEEEDSFDDF